jgi:3-hydroxybutyryl-CoA dehydrogenase
VVEENVASLEVGRITGSERIQNGSVSGSDGPDYVDTISVTDHAMFALHQGCKVPAAASAVKVDAGHHGRKTGRGFKQLLMVYQK